MNPNPELLVNSEKETILESIKEELELCDKFYFSVAFITTNAIALLIDLLLKLERRGVKGIILTSSYLNFTQPLALKRSQKFKNIKLKIATKNNFHSKGYLFKRGDSYNLIVGSSNLTANALLKNSELNLKISAQKDSEIIDSFFNYFKKEFNLASEVDERFLIDYERIYLKNRVFQKSIESKIEKISANSMQIEALANIQKSIKLPSKEILTAKPFVGKVEYENAADKEILSMKFVELNEADGSFLADVHLSNDIRCQITGRIEQQAPYTMLFLKQVGEQQDFVLDLSPALPYLKNGELIIESVDPKQYWRLK